MSKSEYLMKMLMTLQINELRLYIYHFLVTISEDTIEHRQRIVIDIQIQIQSYSKRNYCSFLSFTPCLTLESAVAKKHIFIYVHEWFIVCS